MGVELKERSEQLTGAGGVDRVTIRDFEDRKGKLFKMIYSKLKAGICHVKQERRVLIRKAYFPKGFYDKFLLSLFNLFIDRKAVYFVGVFRHVGRCSL